MAETLRLPLNPYGEPVSNLITHLLGNDPPTVIQSIATLFAIFGDIWEFLKFLAGFVVSFEKTPISELPCAWWFNT